MLNPLMYDPYQKETPDQINQLAEKFMDDKDSLTQRELEYLFRETFNIGKHDASVFFNGTNFVPEN